MELMVEWDEINHEQGDGLVGSRYGSRKTPNSFTERNSLQRKSSWGNGQRRYLVAS